MSSVNISSNKGLRRDGSYWMTSVIHAILPRAEARGLPRIPDQGLDALSKDRLSIPAQRDQRFRERDR